MNRNHQPTRPSLRQVQEVLPVPHLPPSSVRWSRVQHFKRTRKLTGPPKPALPEAAHEEPLSLHGRRCHTVADTLHNRLHFLRNSCSTQGAKPPPGTPMHGSPLLVRTRWTALRLPTLQRRTSRRPQASHTCKAPPPCDCLCSPGPGSACPGEHQSVSSKRHMQALRTPRARTTARTSHHSTHRTRSPTPHGTTAAGHGSKHQGATPLLCPLAGSGPSARRAAAAAAPCRHSSEQVFLPEELRAREVGRVGKHVAHLGGGYVEPLRNAMPDSFP
jgi:hypothetical protein